MNAMEIAEAILDRHPEIESPHADAIVRKNLAIKGTAMGWAKVGDGWMKAKEG